MARYLFVAALCIGCGYVWGSIDTMAAFTQASSEFTY